MMNKRVHKPISGESDESGGQQSHRPNSLVGRLIRELSGAPIGADDSTRPVCKRCHDRGEPSEDLYIDTGEPVYVSLYWQEWTGWQSLGVYHASHADSVRSQLADPQKPLVVFEAEYDELTREDVDSTTSSASVLTDISYVDMVFPEEMIAPSEISL
jgi:hypothetical protein